MTIATVYYTHDIHGFRPFKCVVAPDSMSVTVYKAIAWEWDQAQQEWVWVGMQQHYQQQPLHVFQGYVWVGKDPHNNTVDGNSLLVVHTNGTVTFIGKEVMTFEPRSPILTYVSKIVNGWSYQYAIDRNGDYYLFADNAIVSAPRITNIYNPYSYRGGLRELERMDGYEDIINYYIPGDSSGTRDMIWRSYVIIFEVFDRDRNFIGTSDHIIVNKSGGRTERMTRDQIQQLYDRFASDRGIRRLVE